MRKENKNRFMIAAPSSGSGKTIITCGLLRVLQKRAIVCSSFKCGPDYLDPMFHRQVLGIAGANLDSFFVSQEVLKQQFLRHAEALAVIEGVMGYYDGVAGIDTQASTYELAGITKTPVILVVDGKGSSLSVCALIKGFLSYRPDHNIKGVILNRVSPPMAERLRPFIEALGVALIGSLPVCQAAMLESRHLGLVMPAEVQRLRIQIEELAVILEETLNIDLLLELAAGAEPLTAVLNVRKDSVAAVRIGLAKDQAFCFYYRENLELLEALGAELVPFSPISDTGLPSDLDGLLLGGGYPELHAGRLEENETMRNDVYRMVQRGMPVFAECGGFLYLHKQLEGSDGRPCAMVGALSGEGYATKVKQRFGYIEIMPQRDNIWIKKGETVRGHEFHYWDSTAPGTALLASKPHSSKNWACMHTSDTMMAGFPHLYYPSNPEIPKRFIAQCGQYRKKRLEQT